MKGQGCTLKCFYHEGMPHIAFSLFSVLGLDFWIYVQNCIIRQNLAFTCQASTNVCRSTI